MNKLALVAAALVAGTVASSNAAIVVYNFALEGVQEVPSVVTTGSGSATVTLDTVSGAVTVSGTYQNMQGTVTASHIHGLAAPGVNAGVIVTITHTGGTSGTLSANGILNATQIQGMLDGLTYVNVHSTFKSTGEIRGQVVPTPASLAMLGLGGLVAARRRR
ncbi:MAG TPA: CHRD domain-containing protein [Phycisphaerales bacterium]|nr:CHRD domain-containing protein [Phycisphaerales bacterium]